MSRTQPLTASQPKIVSRGTNRSAVSTELASIIEAVRTSRREVFATLEAAKPAIDAANANAIRAKVSDDAWAKAQDECPAPDVLRVPIEQTSESIVRVVCVRANGTETVTEMPTHRTLDIPGIDAYYAADADRKAEAHAAYSAWHMDLLAHTRPHFAASAELKEADRMADEARKPWWAARKRHGEALKALRAFEAKTHADRMAQIKALLADEGLEPTRAGYIHGLDSDEYDHREIVRLMWQALTDLQPRHDPQPTQPPFEAAMLLAAE